MANWKGVAVPLPDLPSKDNARGADIKFGAGYAKGGKGASWKGQASPAGATKEEVEKAIYPASSIRDIASLTTSNVGSAPKG